MTNDTALFIAGLAFAGLGWWGCATVAFIAAFFCGLGALAK